MTLCHFKIVRVMCRRNFYNARAEIKLYILIRNNRYGLIYNRKNNIFAHNILIALIRRIYGYTGIAQHGFRACSGHDKIFVAALYAIFYMPKEGILFFVFHLCVAQRRFTFRTPIYNTVSLINKPFIIKRNKYLRNSLAAALVHCETLALPVAGGADAFKLLNNTPAVLRLPFPRPLQEFFASQIVFCFALLCKGINYLYLGGNACMVGTRQPQRLIALHTLKTDNCILHHVIQRMPHMQLSRNIGRRHNYCKGFLIRVYLRMKIPFIAPQLIKSAFHR